MATVTARATFVIYKDEPSTASNTATADLHSAPTPSASITTSVTIVTAGDKENLHPVTGRRPATDDALGKKRKTSALATKLLIASGKSTPHPAMMKKRRLASAPPSNVPSEAKEKGTTGAQKLKPPAVRRAHTIPELPKVEEEEIETEEPEHHVEAEDGDDDVTQASVNAKCYALTVSPLADVSKAYEDSPVMSERALPDEERSDTTHDEEVCNFEPMICRTGTEVSSPSFRQKQIAQLRRTVWRMAKGSRK